MFKKIVKKLKEKAKKTTVRKIWNNDKKKKDIFDVSARDLGRASKKLFKRLVIKTIRDW